jgi:polysaccharide pyruvyl transferase CsaB
MYDSLLARAGEVNAGAGRERVVMTGPRTDVDRILAASDIFVGASRSALEALASGLPVILAGPQGYMGLFSGDNQQEAARTNFCCRGREASATGLLLRDVTYALERLGSGEFARAGALGRDMAVRDYSVSRMADDCVRAYDAALDRPLRVVMSGYYGYGNAGDEAILQAVRGGIERACGPVSVTVLSRNPAQTRALHGCMAASRFGVASLGRALRRCDALVSGGGSLLQDQTSTRSLLYYLWVMKLARAFGKKVMIYANGIGPVTREANRRRVRRGVERADVVTLRDADSLAELRAMGVTRDDIRITADPVFMMSAPPREESLRALSSRGIPARAPFAAVCVRRWSDGGGLRGEIAKMCDGMFERYGLSVVFIAMQSPGDEEMSREIGGMMRHPSYVLGGPFSSSELIGVTGMARLVVSMRLHALIFAARAAVPSAAVVCDPKLEAFTREFAMPHAGFAESFDHREALAAIGGVIERREQLVGALRERARDMERAARRDPEYLLELLGGRESG